MVQADPAGARLPRNGTPPDELRRLLREARKDDARWREGRTGSLVYFAGDDVVRVAQEAYLDYFLANGLGPKAFPSLKRLETEVVAMTAGLLGGEHALGNFTSGGTESILLAVKAARDRARAECPQVETPELLLPRTAHPAFDKAAHYFGLNAVRVPVRDDFRADVDAIRQAITANTVLIVGSAPQYPHGVVDPIAELAPIAAERGIPFHVDACVGGYFLPFLRKLGHPVPEFDFRVPGVSSISADLHKYGFGARGASTIVYRDAHLHRYQKFQLDYPEWPVGLYSTPTMSGSRPGGAIAAAWAVMTYLGEEGYLRLVKRMMRTTRAWIDGLNRIPGLEVWGQPDMAVFGYGSRDLDIYAVADGMEAHGWYVNRQIEPAGIHLMITPAHEAVTNEYLRDLADVTETVARGGIAARNTVVTYS